MIMKKLPLILIILAFIIGITVFIMVQNSPEHQAMETVDSFYAYEQDGDFSDSWALFHSQMKNKFGKAQYIQDRAHIFMNHFGVETFTYDISDAEELSEWQMSGETEVLSVVYRVSVNQIYNGTFGKFHLVQDVFVTEEEGKWRILWDYNNDD
jgi:hypothetical protein